MVLNKFMFTNLALLIVHCPYAEVFLQRIQPQEAGIGGVLMLRWLWDRINLYSKIAAIATSLAIALLILATVETEWIRLGIMVLASLGAKTVRGPSIGRIYEILQGKTDLLPGVLLCLNRSTIGTRSIARRGPQVKIVGSAITFDTDNYSVKAIQLQVGRSCTNGCEATSIFQRKITREFQHFVIGDSKASFGDATHNVVINGKPLSGSRCIIEVY
jgi:hypothetical protein